MTKTLAQVWLAALLLLLAGCQSDETRTFAGFTYGGGGHTFSAAPAALAVTPEQTVLECGTEGGPNYLRLSWKSGSATGDELPIATGVFMVEGKPSSELQSGQVVVQSEIQNIAHGSFDLETKTSDGRTFKVVGSFSAEKI